MFLRRLAQLAHPGLQRTQWQQLRGLATELGYESLHPGVDITGKVYCVTGSTDGIGKWTAYLLALHGGTVLVHGRWGWATKGWQGRPCGMGGCSTGCGGIVGAASCGAAACKAGGCA